MPTLFPPSLHLFVQQIGTAMRLFSSLIKALLAGTMIAIVVAVGLGIVFRYLLNAPLFWTDEFSRYALVWMTFLGGAVLVGSQDGHAGVEFFVGKMSPRWRRIAMIVSLLVVTTLLCLITVGGVIWILKSTRASSPAMGIPMIAIYAIIPVSGLIALARLALSLRPSSETSKD